MNDHIVQLVRLIRDAGQITFFGGAGVSTESGIPDFRSAQGLYRQKRVIPPETILSHSFFIRDPESFYAFYRENLLTPNARPNQAHLALARLEALGKLRCVVTQNIDNLHQEAGSSRVCELHGSTKRNYCMKCGKPYPLDKLPGPPGLPYCDCGGLIRPDVVLYEEGLDQAVISTAIAHIQNSDLLIVGGTSLNVYPAAGFVRLCPGKLVIINRDPTPYDHYADLVIHDSIGQTLSDALCLLEQP